MYRLSCVIGLPFFVLGTAVSTVWSHTSWSHRNEPGPWTVVLYHCDDTGLQAGDVIASAQSDPALDLVIQPFEGEALEASGDVFYPVLEQSIGAYSAHEAISEGVVEHPVGELSVELFMKFVEHGADIEIGIQNGISLRVRTADAGDRFQLMGANVEGVDDTRFSAPGFSSFPPVGTWHHYGVTIRAQNVEGLGNGRYRYGAGSRAQFFYDSHAVGFVNDTVLDIEGLEFEAQGKPFIRVYAGSMLFDEIMISNHDWSDPDGHDGASHGSVRVGHAFEDGRQPINSSLNAWSLY